MGHQMSEGGVGVGARAGDDSHPVRGGEDEVERVVCLARDALCQGLHQGPFTSGGIAELEKGRCHGADAAGTPEAGMGG